jgi:molybdopterin converting factor subunit 1
LAEGDIHCTVLFFAVAAEIVGCRQKELTMPIESRVEDVLERICAEHGKLRSIRSSCAVAIDSKLCSTSSQIFEGCTIAFLPPVSGG